MKVSVRPTTVHVSGRVPAQALEALEAALRYHPKGYQHTYLYKFRKWDGWTSLLRAVDGEYIFPAGLAPRAAKALEGIDGAEWVDDRPTLHGVPVTTLPNGTVLYADQRTVLELACASAGRGLLNLATNFGKTELTAALSLSYPGRTLVWVNRVALLTQTATRLGELLQEPVGKLGAGLRPRGHERVIVAMPQSARPGPWLDDFTVMVVDEAHTISPKTWFPLLGRCQAPVRYGLSGTLREAQPLIVEAFLGPMLAEVKEAELVAAGRSATPRILMPYVSTPGNLLPRLAYAQLYQHAVVSSAARNDLIVDAAAWAAQQKWTTLVLVWAIDHGLRLRGLLQQAGVSTGFVSGTTSSATQIEDELEALMGGHLSVLVASGIFNQGINIPSLDLVINAAGWRSQTATRQKLGRALRRKPTGPNRVTVVDPYDWGNKLLERHAEARKKTYEKQGFAVEHGGLSQTLKGHEVMRLSDPPMTS